MIQGKKSSGMYMCVYLHGLNEAYVQETFSKLFNDELLEKVVRNEAYFLYMEF